MAQKIPHIGSTFESWLDERVDGESTSTTITGLGTSTALAAISCPQ